MKKTVLITGVAGLIGSRLADWIIENKPEYKVIGIDDLSGGTESNINPKVDFWQMDLINHPKVCLLSLDVLITITTLKQQLG
mgnify:CR=1 FL=1